MESWNRLRSFYWGNGHHLRYINISSFKISATTTYQTNNDSFGWQKNYIVSKYNFEKNEYLIMILILDTAQVKVIIKLLLKCIKYIFYLPPSSRLEMINKFWPQFITPFCILEIFKFIILSNYKYNINLFINLIILKYYY